MTQRKRSEDTAGRVNDIAARQGKAFAMRTDRDVLGGSEATRRRVARTSFKTRRSDYGSGVDCVSLEGLARCRNVSIALGPTPRPRHRQSARNADRDARVERARSAPCRRWSEKMPPPPAKRTSRNRPWRARSFRARASCARARPGQSPAAIDQQFRVAFDPAMVNRLGIVDQHAVRLALPDERLVPLEVVRPRDHHRVVEDAGLAQVRLEPPGNGLDPAQPQLPERIS